MQKVIVNTANQKGSTSSQFDNNKHEKLLGFLSAKSSPSFVNVRIYVVKESLAGFFLESSEVSLWMFPVRGSYTECDDKAENFSFKN